VHDVYFPGGGACSITKVMQDGATAEIATVGSEGMVGGGVFFGDDQSPGDTFAQIAAHTAYRMPVAAFLTQMELRGEFYDRILRYNQALMIEVMQTTACNGLHAVEQRCCRWLLMTSDRVGNDQLALTHEFLSFMLGVRRPTVTIVLGVLESAGLITARRGTINIVDRVRLTEAACECYSTVKAVYRRLLPEISSRPD
jgi:CRP-like cAMP-binding protein